MLNIISIIYKFQFRIKHLNDIGLANCFVSLNNAYFQHKIKIYVIDICYQMAFSIQR